MAFSTNGNGGGGSLSSEINVTPLIDVLLVMLTIFMVIVPVTPRGLTTALPSSRAGNSDVRPVLVQVEQGATGIHYSVDGQSATMVELAPRLMELLARRSARLVLLKGDGALSFDAISGVIDAGQAAGAESVELITPGATRP